jgi:hypothetical protein
MNVSPSVVNVNGGCTIGSFAQPVIDPDGHFEIDGTYTLVGGAQPPQPLPPTPAHYSGLLRDTNLTLIIRTVSGQTTGPLTLQFGSTDPCSPACP